MIPVLYMLFPSLPPASIISISLGTILLSAALNNWRFYKSGLFPKRAVLWIIAASAGAGALVGAQLVYLLPAHSLKRIFGFLLLIMASQVLFNKKNDSKSESAYKEKPKALGATCIAGGLISSITGLGGGVIFVPFFLSLVKLPMKLVAPYSNVAMMAACLVGLLPHFFTPGSFKLSSALAQSSFIGHVNILFIFCLFAGAFFSSKLGVKLNANIGAAAKKWLLASILLVLAFKILIAP